MQLITFNYLASVIEISALLYAFYRLHLWRSNAVVLQRIYLLLALIIPVILPFLQFKISVHQLPALTGSQLLPVVPGVLNEDLESPANITSGATLANASDLLCYTITTGFLACVLIYIIQTIRLCRILSCSKKQLYNNRFLFISDTIEQPFSFAGKIVIPSALLQQPQSLEMIVAHESAHVMKLHQVDLLLAACCQFLCWWNPFVYFLRKQLIIVHEYEADAIVLHSFDRTSYARLLLSATFKVDMAAITHSFFQSPIKLRIMRLYENNKPCLGRFWFALPVFAFVTFLFCVSFVPVKPGENQVNPYKIVIDAGHGGLDPGASKNGIKEKVLTLKVAKLIAKEAEAAGMEVILTRTEDELPVPGDKNASNRKRVDIVKSENPDVFISLHNNYSLDPGKSGLEAFVSHNDNEITKRSKQLASAILNNMQDAPLKANMQVKQRDYMGIWVLDQSPVPVVMLELGYLSNDDDFKVLSNDENLQKLASLLIKGIKANSGQ